MALLICEGRCNPSLHRIDEAIRQGGRSLTDSIFVAQRALHYTLHIPVGEVSYRCDDCGHVRRFGGSPSIAETRKGGTAYV